MEQPAKRSNSIIKEYLETVCNQIRCKKVHGVISAEIENHINDQKEAYEAQGMEEETAAIKAIEQMGDPVAVGTALDRTHRPKPEWSIIILTSLLLVAGIILRFFTSPQSINGIENYNRQLLFTVVGIGLMGFFYFLDFTMLGKYPKLIFFSLVALTPVIFLLTSPMHGRYMYLTYLIMLFPTAFAGIVYSMRGRGYKGIVLCGLYFFIPLAIAYIAPSFAGILFLTLSCLLILTIAILKGWFGVKKLYGMLLIYLPVIAVFFIGFFMILIRNPYAWERIVAIFNLSRDPQSAGYMGSVVRQLIEGAIFIGPGTLPINYEGVTASQILPGFNDDFLLTYSIHQYGWLVFIIIITLLIVFIARTLVLCAKQKSTLAGLVSLSVISTITFQALVYIAVNLGFILVSPFSLPFISKGNAFLLVNMCLAGILLSVFKTGHFIKDEKDSRRAGKKAEEDSFVKFEDGKLTIDFRMHR